MTAGPTGRAKARRRPTAALLILTASAVISAACAPTPGAARPVITGSPTVGDLLTVSNGEWNVTPTSFGYRWESCVTVDTGCSTVGNNGPSYRVSTGDLGHYVRATVTAYNDAGTSTATAAAVGPVAPGTGLPPDPTTVAPPVDRSVPTSTAASTEFLYTGPDPIQTGVAPGTIEPLRAGVVRGRVLDTSGGPLGGATVTISGHPEYGQTLSRADGGYDLAVNGGGDLTVHLALDGHLPVERQTSVPWDDIVVLDDVVLTSLDPVVTSVRLDGASTTMQVAHGSVETDDAGTRQARLLLPPATTGTLVMPDGSERPLSSAHLRATEYTVGASGKAAMPGTLPPASGYTYAVDLSLDEASAAGAQGVRFDRPLPFYVDDFLHFPAGTTVPVGYYDPATARWVAAPSGVVVAIVGITSGMADLDLTGSGTAADAAALAAMGITDEERSALADAYPIGTKLWRASITHFSAWDLNWGNDFPADAQRPQQPPATRPPDDDCYGAGSIIGCFRQTLGEALPVIGTDLTLRYQSDRQLGGMSGLTIPLTGPSLPASMRRVDLTVTVAGTTHRQSFPPTPNLSTLFRWNGRDAYGRPVQGAQDVTVKIGYVYPAVYGQTGYFGTRGQDTHNQGLEGDRARDELTMTQSYTTSITVWDARTDGLGGWTLDQHHVYDPTNRTVAQGDGATYGADNSNVVVDTAAGSVYGYAGDGGPATAARMRNPSAAAVGPDGSVYIADTGNWLVRRIDPAGTMTTFAGGGSVLGDGGPATAAVLVYPNDVAVAPDGSVYIAEQGRLRRVAPDGTISTVAGDGNAASDGDGGPASAAHVEGLAVAVGPDGSIYESDFSANRVRRIGPDGIIRTFAGTGLGTPGSPSGVAATTSSVWGPYGLAVAPDGTVYLTEFFGHRVRAVRPDGVIVPVAGGSFSGTSGDGGPAVDALLTSPADVALDADGRVLISDPNARRVRVVNGDGTISSVNAAGSGTVTGDGGPAGAAPFAFPISVATSPNTSSVYVVEPTVSRVRRMHPAFPGQSLADYSIPSPDGSAVFQFDHTGRHLRTLDALTAVPTARFGYDSSGRLATVTDRFGNVTSIEHDATGHPSAIVAPGGQRTALTVDADGRLRSLEAPGGVQTQFTYDGGGLLTSLTEPSGLRHTFGYDAQGRLTSDVDPSTGTITLTPHEVPDGVIITHRSPEGRASIYEVHQGIDGTVTHAVTDPSGARSMTVSKPDGTTTSLFPDGSTIVTTSGPDPRFGMAAPIEARTTVTLAGHAPVTTTRSASVTLADPDDLTSVTAATATSTRNGHVTTSSYNGASRTTTFTSPAGRHVTTVVDEFGATTSVTSDGVGPTTTQHDARGRPTRIQQGAEVTAFEYDAANHLVSTTRNGVVEEYTYDAREHLSTIRRPGGGLYRITYDASGEPTGLVTPSGSVHGVSRDRAARRSSYTPPSSSVSFVTDHDRDGNPTTQTSARGDVTHFGYDSSGWASDVSTPDATTSITYANSSHQPGTVTRTPTAGTPTAESFSYDGPVPTGVEFTGAATGAFTYTWDADLRPQSVSLDGLAAVVTTTDPDGFATSIGDLTLDRSGPGGAERLLANATLRIALDYDLSGRLDDLATASAGRDVAHESVTRDAGGRIAHRVLTVDGVTHTNDYHYDADGQLVAVDTDGTETEHYAYDADGNRTSATVDGTTIAVAYDAQGRLTTRGGIAYGFDADGTLLSRGGDTFGYGAGGELLTATVGGTTVSYDHDGEGRRVRRTVAGASTQYLYGSLGSPLQISATRAPDGSLTTYRYDAAGRLVGLDRGGSHFDVATDLRGSPLVVTDATGVTVERRTYDTFGRLVADSNPSFDLPIGYAGGLADPVTGLVRFGRRDYEPESGRWTSRDPSLFASGQGNLYAYAANDPVDLRDLNGREPAPIDQDASGSTASSTGDTVREKLGQAFDFAEKELNSMVFDMALGYACVVGVCLTRDGLKVTVLKTPGSAGGAVQCKAVMTPSTETGGYPDPLSTKFKTSVEVKIKTPIKSLPTGIKAEKVIDPNLQRVTTTENTNLHPSLRGIDWNGNQ